MVLFESTQKSTQLFRHGGREVLRVTATHVAGESAAVKHTQALVSALVSYAERVLLPRAYNALDREMARGAGYTFRAYRYRIDAAEARAARGVRITLRATLEAGDAHEERVLDMLWTQDGAWQKKERHHRTR